MATIGSARTVKGTLLVIFTASVLVACKQDSPPEKESGKEGDDTDQGGLPF